MKRFRFVVDLGCSVVNTKQMGLPSDNTLRNRSFRGLAFLALGLAMVSGIGTYSDDAGETGLQSFYPSSMCRLFIQEIQASLIIVSEIYSCWAIIQLYLSIT